MPNYTYAVSLNIGDLLAPAINRLKGDIRKKLEEDAMRMVQEEIAKFAIDLSTFVNVKDFGKEIVITIRKDIEERK